MRSDDPHTSPRTNGTPRWAFLVGVLLILVGIGAALVVVARSDHDTASSSLPSPPEATVVPSSTSALDPETEVVARLHEILQVRERAFQERNAELFDSVYTTDCSCLTAGREAIAALKKENVRWQDRSVSIDVQSATSINDNLWEIVALFVSQAFRIETEDGSLVREAPAERLRYRFLLVRSSGSWRLGNVSLVK
jgi:hypothetical protein